MTLSKLIEVAYALMAEHGDIEVLDPDCFCVFDINARIPSSEELAYWGQDIHNKTPIAQIMSDR